MNICDKSLLQNQKISNLGLEKIHAYKISVENGDIHFLAPVYIFSFKSLMNVRMNEFIYVICIKKKMKKKILDLHT